MKRFKFTADITFQAEDLDDAFSKLETHFWRLKTADEQVEEDGWFLGTMDIKPIKSN